MEFKELKIVGAEKSTIIVNYDYILTCENKEVEGKDVCTITFVTGKTIDVYGHAKTVHDGIMVI